MKNYDQALAYEIFQKEEYALAKKEIEKADLIFDIWWHIGLFSLRCLKLNPKAKIHYFEPFPQLVAKALENLQTYTNHIIFNQFWLAKEPWIYEFFFNEEKTMQSSQLSSFLNPHWKTQLVRCENLNSYLEKNTITTIDLIKIDVEGMEYEILLNLTTNNWKKIKNLICEVHLFSVQDLQNREKLKTELQTYFQSITIQKSPYTDKILLCFASLPYA